MGNKYESLERYLDGVPERRVTLTLQQIEDVIGDRLPANARDDHTWWANTNNPDRVQARAWLNAGWKVSEVNLAAGAVTLERIGF